MPELPEVETTRRGIERALQRGASTALRIYDRRLRWPIDAQLPETLAGQRMLAIGRRAKYLLLKLERGTLIVHLGMSGSLRLHEGHAAAQARSLRAAVRSGMSLRFHDPRRFGSLHYTER